MQRINIQNFGPIKNADIELKPLIVLIGEQASGKSTLAKLIYFFKTLGEGFFSSYLDSESVKIEWHRHFLNPIRDKFNELFGQQSDNFIITFWYDEERYITLSLNKNKRLNVKHSFKFFLKEIKDELNHHKEAFIQYKQRLTEDSSFLENINLNIALKNHSQSIYQAINALFETAHNDSLYIMAGRNSTVSFAELFEEHYAKVYFRNLVDIGRATKDFKSMTIDESLFMEYISKVRKIRQTFKNAGNFEGMIHHSPKDKKGKLVIAHNIIKKILHGQYADAGEEERIVFGHKSVFLKDASSGQQEAIRILQDLFLILRSDNTVLRIIEEPEAHLYPETQKLLLQLIVMVLNANAGNQILITTHSPYTLSILNNLLYAAQIAQINETDVNNVINRNFWLETEKTAAFQIKRSQILPITDMDSGLIQAEVIDSVSDSLNDEMDKLMTIEINGNGERQ